jgi:hypothetical protein
VLAQVKIAPERKSLQRMFVRPKCALHHEKRDVYDFPMVEENKDGPVSSFEQDEPSRLIRHPSLPLTLITSAVLALVVVTLAKSCKPEHLDPGSKGKNPLPAVSK